MLKSKTFMKKTRSGGVLKIVREHYLRDDIGCGCPCCQHCPPPEKTVLQPEPPLQSRLRPEPHYLLPDTNVLLHQIDILEDPLIQNVIILQTVLQEVRNRSAPVYKRIKDIVHNPDKHFYTFTNEHHRETYIEQEQGEGANDRNDRAIRTAAKWYNEHLKKETETQPILIFLITNDRRNKERAVDEGVVAYTSPQTVDCMLHLCSRPL